MRDYTIQAVLGHGGFGIVYKASHNELGQVVAIKEYLPSELAVREGATVRAKSADCETCFADGLRRFREEARALIDFQQHPSTVARSEFCRAHGTAYLVMEYVDGLPLSQVLREREAAGQPFTESDLLGIAVSLAQGHWATSNAGCATDTNSFGSMPKSTAGATFPSRPSSWTAYWWPSRLSSSVMSSQSIRPAPLPASRPPRCFGTGDSHRSGCSAGPEAEPPRFHGPCRGFRSPRNSRKYSTSGASSSIASLRWTPQ